MTIGMTKIEQIRQQLRTSIAELEKLLDGPLSTLNATQLYQPPAPGEWTIMENLAHIIEFLPYWADEVAKLVATPNQNFGRTMQHEGRLRAIQDHRNDTLAQVKAALPTSYAHLDRILTTLKDSDLDLTGHHSKFGNQTLAWFIQEFITDHLRNHLVQIEFCLTAVSGP